MQTTQSPASQTHSQVYLSRPWAKKYPPTMPKEISLGHYQNIFQMLEESGRKHSKLPAFTNMGVSYTFDETLDKAEAFASYLQNVLKLEKGDRVAIQSPNLLQYPVALFGILKAGLTVVNTNPLYTTREMAHQFKDSGAKAIVILENFADKLEEIIGETQIKHVILTEVGDGLPLAKRLITNFVVRVVKKMVPAHSLRGTRFNEALALGRAAPSRPVQIGLDDVAFLQYTGGTTGVSKAAMLTHKNILSNLTQMSEWFKPKLKEGVESVITALPLYHVFSLTVNCFGLYKIGTNNILVTNPKDIPAFVKLLATSKPTIITAVSTLLGALMTHKDFDSVDFSSVKVTVAGGMALKASVANEWKRRTGTGVLEGYGLTETSPLATCNPLDGQDQLGTIGIPVPSTDVMLIDDDGNPVAQGEAGEICVKGPQVMKGYYNRPEETEKVMMGEWLKTGDMGVMEKDGFFRITDRKKDMILVSGFNVYPNEIEDVIMMHPKVLEAAAIGVPDEHSGEIVKLFVVPRDPSLTIEEVSTFCREKLVAYKCPRKIEFRKEIPKTNIGKPLRRALRDQ